MSDAMRNKSLTVMQKLLLVPVTAVAVTLGGCLDDLADSVEEEQTRAFEEAESELECSTTGKVRRVHDVMESWYLYVDQMPARSPNNFDSPQAMLEALRVNPPDRYSFIADRESSLRFTVDGERVGIGVSLILVQEPDDYRVVDVVEGSPAAEAEMARGDTLLTINGRSVADWYQNEGLDAAFGPDEEGVTVTLSARRPNGEEYSLELDKALFEVDPVSVVETFELADGRTVAYLHFRNFIVPAEDRFDEVFSDLQSQGVNELILDMRYNGGGRLSVAEQLGGQIAGDAVVGEVFARMIHNAARSDNNRERTFEEETGALGLERLVVIGTERTASASELIVNALRPYMAVDIIGERTFGKPVGSYGFSVCEQMLFPIAFSIRNSLDEGDYFDGLAPTCEAPDELERALGDTQEGSLAQALHYLNTGSCDTGITREARRKQAVSYRPRAGGQEGWNPITGGIH